MKPAQSRRKYYRRRRTSIDYKKGVYLLPNILTSMSLFCGFYAIVATMQQNFVIAAWVIVLAAVFDGLDGRVARMTHTTSRFGLEYDSLCDLVAFGVAPAVLSYGLVLNQFGRVGWLAAFLFCACGAMRLARFNTLSSAVSGKFFQGLPIPMAAGMISASIIFLDHYHLNDKTFLSFFLIALIYGLAFLMVSTLRFRSFKTFNLTSRKPFSAVFIAILVIVVVAMEPETMLFCIGVLYIGSAMVEYIIYLTRRTQPSETPIEAAEENK
jgi:CDP-diacylglycerol--serine O-phosphatidyltransferase